MFVQGRYEDAIALALESIQIDLSIGGRFQIAKTLTNIGHVVLPRSATSPRALAYLKRAREAHERYGDQDGRADTLLVSAQVTLELGDLDAAEHLLARRGRAQRGDRAAPTTATHETRRRARSSRARGATPQAAIAHAAGGARTRAESQALVALPLLRDGHRGGRARRRSARCTRRRSLATTALGAVENLQGCEYGLEIRVALRRRAQARGLAAGAQRAPARRRLRDGAHVDTIRDARLRRLFAAAARRRRALRRRRRVPASATSPPRRDVRRRRPRPTRHRTTSRASPSKPHDDATRPKRSAASR